MRLNAGDRAGREYDRLSRDDEAKRFYRSAEWLAIRRTKLRRSPLCERCFPRLVVPATTVHHIKERRECPELALEIDNLESLCAPCHSSHHARA